MPVEMYRPSENVWDHEVTWPGQELIGFNLEGGHLKTGRQEGGKEVFELSLPARIDDPRLITYLEEVSYSDAPSSKDKALIGFVTSSLPTVLLTEDIMKLRMGKLIAADFGPRGIRPGFMPLPNPIIVEYDGVANNEMTFREPYAYQYAPNNPADLYSVVTDVRAILPQEHSVNYRDHMQADLARKAGELMRSGVQSEVQFRRLVDVRMGFQIPTSSEFPRN